MNATHQTPAPEPTTPLVDSGAGPMPAPVAVDPPSAPWDAGTSSPAHVPLVEAGEDSPITERCMFCNHTLIAPTRDAAFLNMKDHYDTVHVDEVASTVRWVD